MTASTRKQSYEPHKLTEGVNLVLAGISYRKASKMTGVPYGTIYSRFHKDNSFRDKRKAKAKLPVAMERRLASWVVRESKTHQSLTPENVRLQAQSYLREMDDSSELSRR